MKDCGKWQTTTVKRILHYCASALVAMQFCFFFFTCFNSIQLKMIALCTFIKFLKQVFFCFAYDEPNNRWRGAFLLQKLHLNFVYFEPHFNSSLFQEHDCTPPIHHNLKRPTSLRPFGLCRWSSATIYVCQLPCPVWKVI